MKRVVIFHFHLFKNAGTSVDTILEKNFGDKFVQKEFAFYPYKKNIQEVINWIKEENGKIAFSSHTARLFDFKSLEQEGIKIIPIIFIRHPIIRIQSAYLFERDRQKDIDTLGTAIARNTTLKGYIDIRWHLPNDHQCANFHVNRFSDMFYEEEGDILSKALKALKELPFVGLVEKFEDSIKRLEGLVKEFFPEFKAEIVYKNVQIDPNVHIEERLKKIKQELGKEFYERLIEKNKEDITFWEEVVKLYEYESFNNPLHIP